ncbi:MAG: response regulator transcription factor [Verrucomicrobia bacterium]|nr:response regulator transcription factor [Verrucomicrobiota bacterium]
MRYTVLHVEDDPFWGQLVAKAIGQWPEFRLVATVPTGAVGIKQCRELAPDIVVLDLRLTDMSGFEVLAALRQAASGPKVLLMTVRNDEVALHQASRPEVAGMILKAAYVDLELREALAAIVRGGKYLPSRLRAAAQSLRATPNAYFKLLTPREIEVLESIATGLDDEEIAAVLGVAIDTVHSHRTAIMRKVEVHCASKLVVWAREKGFAG